MMTSSFCFSESVHKTYQRQPTELKLGKLIAYLKFHKIRKFENYVTKNDVIMMSLSKTVESNEESWASMKPNKVYINQKVLMRAIQNALLIEFEPLRQKLLALLSNIGIFYHACSPNIVISRDQEANFAFFYFVLILHLILGKVTKLLVEKLYISEVISQKPQRGLEIPSAFRVNGADFHLEFTWLVFSAIDNTTL